MAASVAKSVRKFVQVAKRELSMECDYEYEARCQKRFKKLISSDPELAESFNVPDIIDELSGKTVITSEWVPGVHIDKVHALRSCSLIHTDYDVDWTQP